MSIDASELRTLSHDLGTVSREVFDKVEGVVKKGALNIKDTMREDFQNSTHFKSVGRTVNFDTNRDESGIEAVIGPNKYWRAARLANIAYFGTSVGVYRGGPKFSQEVGRGPGKGGNTVDVFNGFREEEPRFLENLRKVAGDVL